MGEWQDQYWRMMRWRRQLDVLNQRRTTRADAHVEQLRDVFFAFFQTCDHMEDWLANADQHAPTRTEVQEYVRASPALLACRDLCNGSRRARLEAKRVDLHEDHKVTGTQTIYAGPAEDEVAKVLHLEPTLTLIYRGEVMNPCDLADRCVADWDQFLEQGSLIHLVRRFFDQDERWTPKS